MNFKDNDLLAEDRMRRSQIVRMISAYCRKYRMASAEYLSIPDEFTQEIAGEIIDLFEDRLDEKGRKNRLPSD